MSTKSIGRAKLSTKAGRTRLEPAKPRRNASAVIGAEKKSKRQADAWRKTGRATIARKK